MILNLIYSVFKLLDLFKENKIILNGHITISLHGIVWFW